MAPIPFEVSSFSSLTVEQGSQCPRVTRPRSGSGQPGGQECGYGH